MWQNVAKWRSKFQRASLYNLRPIRMSLQSQNVWSIIVLTINAACQNIKSSPRKCSLHMTCAGLGNPLDSNNFACSYTQWYRGVILTQAFDWQKKGDPVSLYERTTGKEKEVGEGEKCRRKSLWDERGGFFPLSPKTALVLFGGNVSTRARDGEEDEEQKQRTKACFVLIALRV